MNFKDIEQFEVKTKLVSFLHNYFRVFDAQGNLIAYAKNKGFKLKEDTRIFSDESMTTELMSIKTNAVIDFSAVYEVRDSQTGAVLGSLQRSGFKSLVRDHWTVMGPDGQKVYDLREDSMALAQMRRMLTNLIPATYHLERDDTPVGCEFKQNFNPFLLHFKGNLKGWDGSLDKRLALAIVILLLSIEGKQG